MRCAALVVYMSASEQIGKAATAQPKAARRLGPGKLQLHFSSSFYITIPANPESHLAFAPSLTMSLLGKKFPGMLGMCF